MVSDATHRLGPQHEGGVGEVAAQDVEGGEDYYEGPVLREDDLTGPGAGQHVAHHHQGDEARPVEVHHSQSTASRAEVPPEYSEGGEQGGGEAAQPRPLGVGGQGAAHPVTHRLHLHATHVT